ncbi:Diphthine--ammonia ligase [Erysiphe neolycopersici]|uniref:Diphthine--ammonia ligase n=1 Tax=Erysiphe neolycopersici TaxID=212602 RepID=A0A420I3M2_9PEZI|nr:Diphthine--ammonia ligase [Erysiphe neolycopersici]
MTESLNVIALISGGKDSFFSLLHCRKNGHKIVALGNLYPPNGPPDRDHNKDEDDSDMNSFMYQTVGHMVIPQYEKALNIPLYREPIIGTALHTGASYLDSDHEYSCSSVSNSSSSEYDETECLEPLLKRIMDKHPNANAVSTGAIYSTYQRTRTETVARRLGLVSLSYLWQYPLLSLKNSLSLIEDMRSARIEARIIKVAGSGLDENFLWQNLTSKSTIQKVQKAVEKFGVEDDGAILGEGGEFETLVLDGPSYLFKSRIEILDHDRIIVKENGGSAWLKILKAQVISKNIVPSDEVIQIPNILEPRFSRIFETLKDSVIYETNLNSHKLENFSNPLHSPQLVPKKPHACSIIRWTISAPTGLKSISEEAKCLIDTISSRLDRAGLKSTDVVSTILLLRSMQYFELMNKVKIPF